MKTIKKLIVELIDIKKQELELKVSFDDGETLLPLVLVGKLDGSAALFAGEVNDVVSVTKTIESLICELKTFKEQDLLVVITRHAKDTLRPLIDIAFIKGYCVLISSKI